VMFEDMAYDKDAHIKGPDNELVGCLNVSQKEIQLMGIPRVSTTILPAITTALEMLSTAPTGNANKTANLEQLSTA